MSYRIVRFGNYAADMVTLPVLGKTHDMGSGASRMLNVDSPDGQVDLLGNERAKRGPYTLPVSCTLYDTTPANVQTNLDQLKAMRGKVDKLWMELYDGSERWIKARLDSVSGPRKINNGLYISLTLAFYIKEQSWSCANHGPWLFDDGEYFDSGLYFDGGESYALDSSPKSITVNNGGNVDVDDLIMTVTARTSNITALVIKRLDGATVLEHLIYSGTILVGESLVVNCGSLSVQNDGAGDSAHLTRGTDHTYDGWMRLEPGDNTIQVTRTGGGADSTIDFNFYDKRE